MPKRLREKNKVKHTAATMMANEGKRLEPVIEANMSLSLMVKPKESGLGKSSKEDVAEELFTLNI